MGYIDFNLFPFCNTGHSTNKFLLKFSLLLTITTD